MKARRNNLPAVALLAAAMVALLPAPARAVTQLKRMSEAPAVALKEVSGADVTLRQFRGRVVVLVFGELYHEKTVEACRRLDGVLREPRWQDQPVVTILVTTQGAKPADLQAHAADHLPPIVLHDPGRKAFGDYQVAVMPSVVVVDREGRVAHAVAALTPRFADVLSDSMLYAAGKLSAQRFEQTLNPPPATTAPADQVRAERLALLARQLARRGLDDMAAEKYRESLQLLPGQTAAHLELGLLLLKQDRLADADEHFQLVLAQQPQSVQALLGSAFVRTLRGGEELTPAERTVRDVLARNPSLPRAHYLLGLILEKRNKPEDAAASFKKAAQLLLERGEQE
jgi:Tfp pilus assembly protein PilF/peroxiredoxin